MNKNIQILVIEDEEADLLLIEHALKKDGYVPHMLRIQTESEYSKALKDNNWDIVISDYSLPNFNILQAIDILNELKLDIPFFVVSEIANEEMIVSALRAGAAHFISKNNLSRLPIIVERALYAVSLRKKNREELRKHRDHLEELVKERTSDLAATNEKLKRECQTREKIENALSKNEAKYRALIEGGMDGICILKDCKFTYVNQQFEQISGYTSEELFDTPFETYITQEYLDRAENACACIMEGTDQIQRFEAALVQKAGRSVDVEISAKLINYPGDEVVMLVVRDITGRKMAERIAHQGEHIEALNVVSQGVAQSFANITTVINSFAASIADSFLPNTKPYNAAKRILEATQHANDLTKRLYSVSSRDEKKKNDIELVSLAKTIKSARSLVERSLSGNKITLRIKHYKKLPFVMANETELLDTLIHLFLNAIDAMPDGGIISIKTIERRISKPKSNPDSPGGTFIGICIQDTGEGMTKDQVNRVFEPFYTTKTKEDSFGLGLPSAQSMAQSWGGWIDLRSKPGRGTRLRVFIPKAASSADKSLQTKGAHGKTVLVLDDNKEHRSMMTEVLNKMGHSVLDFVKGSKALQSYSKNADNISLLVIDWIMPDGDGVTILQEILKQNPKANIVIVSGFSRDYARSQIRFGAWEFLQKPFSEVEFLDIITKSLNKQ